MPLHGSPSQAYPFARALTLGEGGSGSLDGQVDTLQLLGVATELVSGADTDGGLMAGGGSPDTHWSGRGGGVGRGGGSEGRGG